MLVCLHDFKVSDIISVFEPFLDFARSAFGPFSEEQIDGLLEECKVYSLHKSVFKSFFLNGLCVREENLLIDEVAFEQDKIASAVVNIVSRLAGDRQVIFLLNDMQYANGSSMHFIHNLIEDDACHILSSSQLTMKRRYLYPTWSRCGINFTGIYVNKSW